MSTRYHGYVSSFGPSNIYYQILRHNRLYLQEFSLENFAFINVINDLGQFTSYISLNAFFSKGGSN